jgi:cell wall-associated NlpC family hydrolase
MKNIKNIKNILKVTVISTAVLASINMQALAANTATIKVETANLRQKPTSDSKILEQASQSDKVEILEKDGQWYKVKYKSIEGYLRQDLLDVKEDTQTESNNEENTVKEPTQETTQTVAEPENQTSEEQKTAQENNITENKIGTYKVKQETSIRIIPLIQASTIDTAKAEQKVNVTDIKNNWAYIEYDNKQGWIILDKIEYVGENDNSSSQNKEEDKAVEEKQNNEQKEEKTEEKQENLEENNTVNKTKYVSPSAINLRQKPNTSSDVIKSLTQNTEVKIIEESNGWSKVEVNGEQGYVSTQLLSDRKQETSRGAETVRQPAENEKTEEAKNNNTNISKNNEQAATTNKGAEVVAYAKQYLGYKYVYGGTTTSGFDCSGFTQYVYKHFGVSINRTAAAQYANGTAVTNLQTGDLVMFGKSGINHVGIYISGGTFIHAANPSRGVTTDTLLSGYYKTNYVGARRIFN